MYIIDIGYFLLIFFIFYFINRFFYYMYCNYILRSNKRKEADNFFTVGYHHKYILFTSILSSLIFLFYIPSSWKKLFYINIKFSIILIVVFFLSLFFYILSYFFLLRISNYVLKNGNFENINIYPRRNQVYMISKELVFFNSSDAYKEAIRMGFERKIKIIRYVFSSSILIVFILSFYLF